MIEKKEATMKTPRVRGSRKTVAATKTAAQTPVPATPEDPKTIRVDADCVKLLARGTVLSVAFDRPHDYVEYRRLTAWRTQFEALAGQEGQHEIDASSYVFDRRVMGGVRNLVAAGALSREELAALDRLEQAYALTRTWDKRQPVEPSAAWRLRVWLLDNGYAEHLNSRRTHASGLPPGSVALVDRWRAEVDGQHVLAIYPDCVREATITTPYNYASWHVGQRRPYATPAELDAILRPWVTKPGTAWDAPKAAAMASTSTMRGKGKDVHVGAATAAALLRAVAINAAASEEDARLVREFLAGLKDGA